jgi:hypothetical protein
MPEELNAAQGRRSADIPVGKATTGRPAWRTADIAVSEFIRFATRGFVELLAWLWTACCAGACFKLNRRIRFRKYRVAPRLGTLTVQRRLLFGLNQHAPLSATRTAFL